MKKIILITGSTDGIGKLVATKLAAKGHTLYLHGRNSDKLSKVVSEMKKETQNDSIKGLVADFSKLEEVREMGIKIKNEIPELDILINNAGIYNNPQSHTAEGFDMRMVVNYFAPYILTNSLLPLLEKSKRARIINLSSAAQAPISYPVLLGEEKQMEGQVYAQSKLALTMWSFYLAKKVENIAVIAVNPGSLLETKMVKEAFGNSWSSADKGASILYDLALLEEYEIASGRYFDNDKGNFEKAHLDAYDEEKIDELIKITNELLKR